MARGRFREEHAFVIQELKRVGAPEAFQPRRPKSAVAAKERKVVAQKLVDARDRLTWSDVPPRVLTRALVKTADVTRPKSQDDAPALRLAGALLGRTDDLIGTDAAIVADLRRAIEDGAEAVREWVKTTVPSVWELPACTATVKRRPRTRGSSATGAGQVLEIRTDCTRIEPLAAIWPCIQPLNWPHCNEMFRSVTVAPHSFTTEPDVAAFKRIVPNNIKLDKADAIYGCRYVEDVDLCGLVVGKEVWDFVEVQTVLECIEWQRHDAFGECIEVGMAYRHSERDVANKIVDVDEGYAILEATDPCNGQPAFKLTTLKRISFKDTSAITRLAAEPELCELFCLEWSFGFEVTADDCANRAVITAREVEELSTHPSSSSNGGASVGPAMSGHWMADWMAEASEYWREAASVGFRQTQRLEERRAASGPMRTEDAFYDALEVWEANRRSLGDGLELTRRFWSTLMGGQR